MVERGYVETVDKGSAKGDDRSLSLRNSSDL